MQYAKKLYLDDLPETLLKRSTAAFIAALEFRSIFSNFRSSIDFCIDLCFEIIKNIRKPKRIRILHN